ncbi:MAG: NADH-ubiquinone oxidoreductase chain C, partial [uncultured Corynebacteriales bacterium]
DRAEFRSGQRRVAAGPASPDPGRGRPRCGPPRFLRRARVRRHLRLRRTRPPAVVAGPGRAAVRGLLRRGRRRADRGVPGLRRGGDEGRHRPRRADLRGPPGAPGRPVPHPAGRPGAAVRAVLGGQRRRLHRHPGPAPLRRAPDLDDVPAAAPAGDLGPGRGPAHPLHHRGLPDRRLAGAGVLGHVRDRLRRPPGADPDPHAGRLGGSPAAQGLPARRRARAVQGRHHPAAGRATELLV